MLQSLDDPLVYHYLPDSPRLATKNGKPRFSFLEYARTQETGEAGITRARGGGIVHFLVTYGADEARVQTAEQGLQEKVPSARLAGPIVYRRASFALVTSFTEENETVTRTVAVGKAPLMEGQKAAVSMALTREGASCCWESFQSATPDISLVFDMEFAGVREPYEAKLEADWCAGSRSAIECGRAKFKWFGVDVDLLFEELRQDGAVKITTRGENATLDKILESANAKLLQVMFDQAPAGELARMASDKGYSSLDQAVKMLKTAKPTAGAKFKRITRSSVSGFDRRRVRFAVLRDEGPGRSSPVRLAPATLRGATDERAKKFFAQAEEAYAAKDYERAFGLLHGDARVRRGQPVGSHRRLQHRPVPAQTRSLQGGRQVVPGLRGEGERQDRHGGYVEPRPPGRLLPGPRPRRGLPAPWREASSLSNLTPRTRSETNETH